MEFALLLPVFMILVLGMFSGGLAYNKQIALRNAAREGARWGSVLPRTPEVVASQTWAQRVEQVVVERSEGELTLADVCVALVEGASGTVVPSPSGVSPSPYSTDGSRCYDDGGADNRRRVQVRVTSAADIEAFFFTRTVTLDAESAARYEGS